MDRGAWWATVHGLQRVIHVIIDTFLKLKMKEITFYTCLNIYHLVTCCPHKHSNSQILGQWASCFCGCRGTIWPPPGVTLSSFLMIQVSFWYHLPSTCNISYLSTAGLLAKFTHIFQPFDNIFHPQSLKIT